VGGDVVVGGDGRMLMINCCTKCPGTIWVETKHSSKEKWEFSL
jgi:hypothetical protein